MINYHLSLLKSNGSNSISKDALRDKGCSWLINCTTQEYLVNVGQDSHFNMPLTCGGPTKHVDHNRGGDLPNTKGWL
jgi:hypothetical protein